MAIDYSNMGLDSNLRSTTGLRARSGTNVAGTAVLDDKNGLRSTIDSRSASDQNALVEQTPYAFPTTIIKGNITITDGGTITIEDQNGSVILSYVATTGALTFNGEVAFTDEITHDVITQNFGTNVAVTGTASSSLSSPASEGADKAFDQGFTTKWLGSAFSNPSQIAFEFANPNSFTVRKYAITTGDDAQDRDLRSWDFQGSTTGGGGWSTIETRTDEWFGPRRYRREFFVDNNTAYDGYRLNVTANWSSSEIQITELELYESG